MKQTKWVDCMVSEEIIILLRGMDEKDITSILNKYKDINEQKTILEEAEEIIKTKLKAYLKQRNWKRYKDIDTDISVSLSLQKKEKIDKEQLRLLLTESQLTSVYKIISVEKLSIVTPELRNKLKKFLKAKK